MKHASFIPLAFAMLLLSGCYGGPRDHHRHWHEDHRPPPPGGWQQPPGGGDGWNRPQQPRW
ncbi:hypothetical protein [Acetobacter papayae]|uniref:hypothetical protein n=1 Tax=Acetobacter papayae TaxID=1076592 RepID=UPI00046F0481|nr:hypothetical protein [Acetobacter papayae]